MPEATVKVAEVKALRTQSGKTRFVLVDETGNEYTTFKEPIARDAVAAEAVPRRHAAARAAVPLAVPRR